MAQGVIKDTTLTAIANAIRAKTGEMGTILPKDMPAAIRDIQGGGGLMQLEGEGGYICGYPGYYTNDWLGEHFAYWFLPNWGPVKRLEGLCYRMDISPIDSIVFDEIDEEDTYSKGRHQLSSIFRDSYGRSQPPILIGPCSMGSYAFASHDFESIPEEVTEQLVHSGYSANYYAYLFQGCYKLQDISGIKALSQREEFQANAIASGMYSNCIMLKECYIPKFKSNITSTSTSNFTTIFSGCRSLENIEWGNTSITNTSYRVTLDLSTSATGYWNAAPAASYQAYGFGQPENEITDLDSYNALKDNPYAWTTNPAFSSLNHTNAVRIINNLPTISYGGTLSFNGTEGSGYGDPISDLTEEEIAVATSKGWTVTIK